MRQLLIRPGAIGDCILALPALEHLRADYTEVWISSPMVPLIQFAASVRPIGSTGLDLVGLGELEVPTDLIQKLQSFDSIVSWYGSSRPEFRDALANIQSSCVFYPAFPPPDYNVHATDFFAEQVGAPRGLIPKIFVRKSATRHSIVIHPFSGSARKNWPLKRYRELAADVAYTVEWIVGPEQELQDAVRFGSLASLAEWISGARLYIGNDSGITHLAAAVGVPTLALFGPTTPEVWAPRGDNVTVLYSNPLEALQIESVLSAVNRLLDSP
jgi:heptosyltransferase III